MTDPKLYPMRPPGRLSRGLNALISQLPACPVMVEIGCYAGESTQLFARSGKFKLVMGVDPWVNDYDPADQAATFAPMQAVERAFDKRVAPYPFVRKFKMTSQEASKIIQRTDFVYIDGDHRPVNVELDITLWSPKTQWIAFHDYYFISETLHRLLGKPEYIYEDSSCMYKLR